MPHLEPGSKLLYTWSLPGVARRFTLRRDALGFILMWMILRYNDLVERLDGPGNDPVDEGGYNDRHIAGTSTWSLHAYGQADDLNWNKHPSNTPTAHSFTRAQIKMVHATLAIVNRIAGGKMAEWGGDWPSHPGSTAKTDSMHHQINVGFANAAYRRVAAVLAQTPRGRRIIKANPKNLDYKKVML
jgi:hypothetical protein